jgi:peptidoglycan DL-endopeptidase CwlO
VPAPTPSLAIRAAVVATGTTAAALLTLLPAAPPAPAPTAVFAPWVAGPAGSPDGGAAGPFQTARHALGTPQVPAAASPVGQAPAAGAPAAPGTPQAPAAVRVPVTLVAAAKPATAPAVAAAGRRGSAMSIAMGKLGSPYRWGAAGPGAFDCSGLVYWSYRQAGLTLPRSSRAQSQVGTAVSKAALQPGDLVFFYRPVSHVAIYIGNGRVVHASTAGKPVKISNLNDMPFSTARRI